MKLVEGSAEATHINLKRVVDQCSNMQLVCTTLLATTERTRPVCDRAISGFANLDEGELAAQSKILAMV